jgi:hypothetical protein
LFSTCSRIFLAALWAALLCKNLSGIVCSSKKSAV